MEINKSASRRDIRKRRLHRLGGGEVSGLGCCGDAEVAAFDMW